MRPPLRFMLALTASILAAMPAASTQAENPQVPVDKLFADNSHPIVLSQGKLSGPGADILLKAAEEAQFFLIGEQHNAKEIPEFTSALFRQIGERYGYGHLALEQDPFAAVRASADSLRGRLDRIGAFVQRYPAAFTFRTDEELAMIADAGRNHRLLPVWGLDQVFGATHVLDRLVELAPDRRTRARTAALAAEVRQAELAELARKSRFMNAEVEKTPEFLALPTFYRRVPGSEADMLITQLFKSLDIYRNWWLATQKGQLTRYKQSFEREENMKYLFVQNYESAKEHGERLPKVLLKLGHNHSIRGRNRSGILTIGNFVSEFAMSNGSRSFHLAIYANNDQAGYYDIISTDSDYGALARAASPRAWAVVDLRPLRAMAFAGAIPKLTAEQSSVIFGFDAVLLIGSQAPGHYSLMNAEAAP